MTKISLIRWLILAILLLTVFDAVCTVAGIQAGMIIEGNPLAGIAVQTRPALTAASACVYTAALLAVVYHFGPRARCTVPLLIMLCAVRLMVAGMHLGWIMCL